MAAVSPEPTKKGGRKSVDFVVNLVPTIDLLTVLIAFLLLTAVWTQLARIDVDQALQRTTDKPQREQTEQEKILNVLIGKKGVFINFTGEEPKQIPSTFEFKDTKNIEKSEAEAYLKMQDNYIKQVKKELEEFKKRAVENQRVILASEDDVQYNFLILVMDACLSVGLNKIVVADESAVSAAML